MKINPFFPNSPVPVGNFAGRQEEIGRLTNGLARTKANIPSHFLITGERGIGKTSLLHYLKWAAEDQSPHGEFKFATVSLSIDKNTTQLDLFAGLQKSLAKTLEKHDSAKELVGRILNFAERVEGLGFALKESKDPKTTPIVGELVDIITEAASRLKAVDVPGILILIDEADKASSDLDVGSLLKLVTESLQSEQANNVSIALSGLTTLIEKLNISHPSSLRILEHIELKELAKEDIAKIVERSLALSRDINGTETTINAPAISLVHMHSEGLPYFVQQICYDAFELDSDGKIDENDVSNAIFSLGGAFDKIGERYYAHSYAELTESQKKVLSMIAGTTDLWISKQRIASSTKLKPAVVTKALAGLISQGLIKRDAQKPRFQVQQKALSFWLNQSPNSGR